VSAPRVPTDRGYYVDTMGERWWGPEELARSLRFRWVSELDLVLAELRRWDAVEVSWAQPEWRVRVRRVGDLDWQAGFGPDLLEVLRSLARYGTPGATDR
jgi:hypothetical protein